MASWLVRSSLDRSDPVLSPGACFLKVPGEKFSRPESRGIISNLIMITELFYLHILSKTRSSLHTRFFRSIHRSVFRYRFTKIWLYRPENVPLVEDTALCSWARHSTLTVPLSTQVYKWLLVNCWGKLKNCNLDASYLNRFYVLFFVGSLHLNVAWLIKTISERSE